MSASASDKFKKLTNNFSTTLSAAIVGAGDTSMSLTSTTNLPTDTGTVFVIDRVDSAGVASPSLREYVKGTVSGTSVTNLVRGLGGSTAQAHSTGAVVEQVVDQNTINDLVDGILVEHNQGGTHAAITTTSIDNSGALTQTGASTFTGAMTIKSYDGWITSPDTWTYASGSGSASASFTVSGDKTAIYKEGMPITFVQSSTTKYGWIVADSTYSSPNTTVEVWLGTDYTMANATISSAKYAPPKQPGIGFPVNPTKWTVTTSDNTSQLQSSPTASTWYNKGGSLSIPIGSWLVSYQACLEIVKGSTAAVGASATLSTANNSASDSDFIAYQEIDAGSATLAIFTTINRSKHLTLASATTYYLNALTGSSGATSVGFRGDNSTTFIRAVCAYL